MVRYSTISVPRALHDELRKVKENPELGYSSIAELAKEAIRLHVACIRRDVHRAFLQRIDLAGLLQRVELLSSVEGGRYRQLFEDCAAPAFIASRDGQIVNCNHAVVDQLGYNEKEDLLGRDVSVLFASQRALNEMMAAAQSGPVKNREIEMRRRDGKTLDFLLSVGTLQEEGRVSRYVAVGKDVTPLQQRLDREARRREIYEHLINEAWDTVVVIQGERIRFVNKQMGISGYRAEELVGKNFLELVGEKDREQTLEAYRQVMEDDALMTVPFRLHQKDGEAVQARAELRRITFDGRPALLVSGTLAE